ncbi:MAG: lipopolysaccharide biosynthesis protein [Victivallales bacterium]|jgi:O-antigen/teichoic acid export membrane protein|nr:lipopolysaccharide biosynthesis protein [Victivallales bacterium]
MSGSLKHKILSGVFYQGMCNAGSYALNFAISIILARLLTPEEFGVVAIVGVFVALFGVFVDSGFSAALIQKKELTKADSSSVFFLNIAMALIAYSLLFIAAPYIAEFYARSELTLCIRILSLCIIFISISLVQGTMINRNMHFHLNLRIVLISLMISGGLGIYLAFRGFGVWALIFQQLCRSIVSGVLLWFYGKWRPAMIWDFTRIRTLFRFGWKLFCSGFLDTLYNNLYPLLLGKLFNFATLSYYNRGSHIPSLGMSILNSTAGSVLFPAFSSIQHDPTKMGFLMKRALKNIMFLVIPTMAILFVTAEPLVVVLFGEPWLPSAPYLRICCFIFLLWPLHTTNLQLLTACGRSDVFLILEIYKKTQIVLIALITFHFGPLVMVSGLAVGNALSFVANSFMSKKLVNYGTWQQTVDLIKPLVCSVFSGSCAYLAICHLSGDWAKLLVGGGVFAGVYLLLSAVFRLIPHEILDILKQRKFA